MFLPSARIPDCFKLDLHLDLSRHLKKINRNILWLNNITMAFYLPFSDQSSNIWSCSDQYCQQCIIPHSLDQQSEMNSRLIAPVMDQDFSDYNFGLAQTGGPDESELKVGGSGMALQQHFHSSHPSQTHSIEIIQHSPSNMTSKQSHHQSSKSPANNGKTGSGRGNNNRGSNRNKKDVERVKKPMNAFLVWSRRQRRKISKENPEMPPTKVSKVLGTEWQLLSKSDKIPFFDEAKRLKDAYMKKRPDHMHRFQKTKTLMNKENHIKMSSDLIPGDSLQEFGAVPQVSRDMHSTNDYMLNEYQTIIHEAALLADNQHAYNSHIYNKLYIGSEIPQINTPTTTCASSMSIPFANNNCNFSVPMSSYASMPSHYSGVEALNSETISLDMGDPQHKTYISL